ncbi:MAG: ABC transporter permease, partial [Desulfitobacteriaceae bacterium]|nr:ABC transporter permease [Desulfitobacteriaceae bacterium]
MFNVNNKKAINNLALKSFQANKLRNIFAVVAIVLTTILFTSLFTVSSSLLDSMQESTMRQVGGSFHGTFKYLQPEEYEKLKTHKLIKDIGYSVVLGFAENKELLKRPSEIRYTSSAWQAKGFFALPTTGRLPQDGKELAADTIVLEKLGIPCELGQRVTLEYTLSGQKIVDTFTLVGFWEGDMVIRASQIWLSQKYVEDKLIGYIPMYEGDFVGTINADVSFNNSSQIEKKLQKVIVESGYGINDITYGVNWAYIGNKEETDLLTVTGIVGIILLIIFCGYLIISNIFYIAIAKDIQDYGLLKAVG